MQARSARPAAPSRVSGIPCSCRRRAAFDPVAALGDHVGIAAGVLDPASVALRGDHRGRDAIKEIKRATHGVPDQVETVLVRHGGGGDVQAGTSRLTIKTYDQGRLRWQGETLDFVWFDEEPPEDIYFEGLTRTNARGGIVTLTFTPLKGMSEVVRRFLQEKPAGTVETVMTINDALHYTEEQRKAIIATYPAHEREARINGTPTLGSGRIFPVAESLIQVEPFAIPDPDALPDLRIATPECPNGFAPYARNPETLARPWAAPGTPGMEHRIGGLDRRPQGRQGRDGRLELCRRRQVLPAVPPAQPTWQGVLSR